MIIDKVSVTSIKEKIREVFGHIKRSLNISVRICGKINLFKHGTCASRSRKS